MRKKDLKLLLGAVLLLVAFITTASIEFRERRDGILTVSFLDVGQGDAIFIDAPNGNQVLLDAGRNADVLRELSSIMPFYDRSIDMVMYTHLDMDHVGGISTVFETYNISYLTSSSLFDSSTVSEVIQDIDVSRFIVKQGDRLYIDRDNDIYIDILFPTSDLIEYEGNDSSLIVRLVYGENSFLFTGDAPASVENFLTQVYGDILKSTVLKAGHHGSRTSSDYKFVETVDPEYVIISAAKDNQYGHPHDEVVAMYASSSIPLLYTWDGTITFKTNGEEVWLP